MELHAKYRIRLFCEADREKNTILGPIIGVGNRLDISILLKTDYSIKLPAVVTVQMLKIYFE